VTPRREPPPRRITSELIAAHRRKVWRLRRMAIRVMWRKLFARGRKT